MVDVAQMPRNAFGYVPTPALVAPIEFTMRLDDYAALGGHMDRVERLEDVLARSDLRQLPHRGDNPWPTLPLNFRWKGGDGDDNGGGGG